MAEAPVNEEITDTNYLHRLVCQLCDKIFEEDIVIACVHLTFCRSCLEQNGLHNHELCHDMICTECSGKSVNDEQWDPQQQTLSFMRLRAKCRRGLLKNCDNFAVNLLCLQLNEALNINESTSSSTPSLPGSFPPTNRGGIKPCLGQGCKTCPLVLDVPDVTGPSGKTVNVDGNFTCRSKRVIYYIRCKQCKKAYVGKTTQKLQDRMSQHCRDIKKKKNTSVATHFNLPDHTIEYLSACVLKTFHPRTSRKTILNGEKEMILHLRTIEPHGMNKG